MTLPLSKLLTIDLQFHSRSAEMHAVPEDVALVTIVSHKWKLRSMTNRHAKGNQPTQRDCSGYEVERGGKEVVVQVVYKPILSILVLYQHISNVVEKVGSREHLKWNQVSTYLTILYQQIASPIRYLLTSSQIPPYIPPRRQSTSSPLSIYRAGSR